MPIGAGQTLSHDRLIEKISVPVPGTRHFETLTERLIREAGGVPVMAHPGITRRDELIAYLVRLGVGPG